MHLLADGQRARSRGDQRLGQRDLPSGVRRDGQAIGHNDLAARDPLPQPGKFISVAPGRVFGAWVDLREGETFGEVFTAELDSSLAIFIPRGVGNGFQTLEDNTAYSYLINDHWLADAQGQYTFLNLGDESVGTRWPIPLDRAELSDKDRRHPRLLEVVRMPPRRVLISGANGQLGRALRAEFDGLSHVDFATREEIDLADPQSLGGRNWRAYTAIVNAVAYTSVDQAETEEGRRQAWAVNVTGVAALAKIAAAFDLTLVHVSSDYVFDGSHEVHAEDETFSPLGVYGQSKAAGDAIVSVVPRHYIVRTSWVIGELPVSGTSWTAVPNTGHTT